MVRISLAVLALSIWLVPGVAWAACLLGMVDRAPLLHRAAFTPVQSEVPQGTVKITYVGHSSFVIETPEGASVVTDYNGINVPFFTPDIVSMNNPHSTHYTDNPDPGIRFVLRGWDPGGGLARNDVRWKDMHVFSVPTNIGETWGGGRNSSSIFVFQIANLCLAHLGHLHHVLSREQLMELGRIDVLFVPIDGSSTLSHPDALTVIDQISPRLVIPMHFGFFGSAERFFERAKQHYPIRAERGSVLLVDRASLPSATEIRFLQAEAQF